MIPGHGILWYVCWAKDVGSTQLTGSTPQQNGIHAGPTHVPVSPCQMKVHLSPNFLHGCCKEKDTGRNTHFYDEIQSSQSSVFSEHTC